MFSFKYKVAEVVYQHWFLPKHLNMDTMNMMEFMYSLYRKSRKRKLRCDEKWEGFKIVDSDMEYTYYKSYFKRNKRQCLESHVEQYSNGYKESIIEIELCR